MPCGSRSRRNRHNRQRKRFQRTSTPPLDDLAEGLYHLPKVIEEESSANVSENETGDQRKTEGLEKQLEVNGVAASSEDEKRKEEKIEERIDGDTLMITTEKMRPEELPYIENLSTGRGRIMRHSNRCKIEKKMMNTDTKIYEITTIRNAVPMEARLDHIAGVGIVESTKDLSPTENGSSRVTISEPTDPLEPLSKDLTKKVENLPGANTCMALAIPMKRFDFLEIQEISESDAEFDESNQKTQHQGIIVEAESDVERDSSIDERRKDESEDEADESMSWEMEKKLRSFIEGLKLPNSPTAASASMMMASSKLPESNVNAGGRDAATRKSARKRAVAAATAATTTPAVAAASFGSYQSQMSQESNRCLDIIQEEAETKNVDEVEEEQQQPQQHIRDFINEEIGKFRRERRDLKTVLREGRNSFEMEDESAKVDSKDKNHEASNTGTKLKDLEGVVIEEVTDSIAESSKMERCEGDVDTDVSELDCDIKIDDDNSVKENLSIEEISETGSGFAQDKNVETFMSLVKSLKESVINDVNFDGAEMSEEVKKSAFHNTKEENVENKCITSETESSHESKNSIKQESLGSSKTTNSECISELENKNEKVDMVVQSDETIGSARENAVLEEIEVNSEMSKPEASLEPTSSLAEDVVKVKNNECNNEVDLEEELIHSGKRSDTNNEITKPTTDAVRNDESYDKNNDEIILREALSNVDANCKNNGERIDSIKTNTPNTNSERRENENEFLHVNIIEESDSPKEKHETSTIIESENKEGSHSMNKNVAVEISGKVTSLRLNEREGSDEKQTEYRVPIEIENQSTVVVDKTVDHNHEKTQNKEYIIPMQTETKSSSVNHKCIQNTNDATTKYSDRVIPIEIETKRSIDNVKNIKNINQQNNENKERIIPVTMETNILREVKCKNEKIETTETPHKMRKIPIEIETKPLATNVENINQCVEKPQVHEERIIPIQTKNNASNVQPKTHEISVTTEIGSSSNLKTKIQNETNIQHREREIPVRIEAVSTSTIKNENQTKTLSEERKIPIQIEIKSSTPTENKSENIRESKVEHKERKIPIEIKTKLSATEYSKVKTDESKVQPNERQIPVKIEMKSETINSEIQNTGQSNSHHEECKIPIKLEEKMETKIPIKRETKSSVTEESRSKIAAESKTECKERKIPVNVETKSTTIKTEIQKTEKSTICMKERKIPIKVEEKTTSATDNKAETKVQNTENSISVKMEEGRSIPIHLETPASSKENKNAKTIDRTKNRNDERVIPIKLENEAQAPVPPKRSTSLRQATPPSPFEAPVYKQAFYVDSIAPPPPLPLRRRRMMLESDSCYPPDFPPYPETPKFHQRAFHSVFDLDDGIESIDFVKALLVLLSNSESTRQDVQSLLLQYDLQRLPASVRGIVDELLAPTPSLSSSASTSSDVYAELCNELYGERPRADNNTGIGEPASLEIAPPSSAGETASSRYSEAPREKFSQNSEKEEEEAAPPRPPPALVQIEESRHCETSIETTTAETLCERSVITVRPKGDNPKETIVPPASSCNAVSPVDFPEPQHQQQDSSSSAASCSTAKYNPATARSPAPSVGASPNAAGTRPTDDCASPPKRSPLPLDGEGEEESSESPQPIPYSPLDGRLDYARWANLGQQPPDTLRELCVRKILSMPRGEQLVGEIPIPRLSVSGSLNAPRESLDRSGRTQAEARGRAEEMTRQRSKNWTGVPTQENPRVLVCFSPAQREALVKTSADNLLDLHKKFINRRGYFHDHSHSVSPPKYLVDVSPVEAPDAPVKSTNRRLLHIIKENSGPTPKPNGFVPRQKPKAPDDERLRATRLSDWLSLARRPDETLGALTEHRCDKTHRRRAPVDAPTPDPTRHGATTPTARRSPISFGSAIIDRSLATPTENRKPVVIGRCGVDPWYVNPALIIEDKPEVPPKVKKTVTLDPDCIDTRSIFDQGPTAAPKKHADSPEAPGDVNPRQMQAEARQQKRFSLPQEYFDVQLKYIQRLENQLKEAVVAEEEERRAAERFQREIERKRGKADPGFPDGKAPTGSRAARQNAPSQQSEEKRGGRVTHEDQWQESSKKIEADSAEYESKEGSRELRKESKREKGIYTETSSERIEEREERRVTTSSKGSKLKDFLRDLNDPSLDKPAAKDGQKKKQKVEQRPVSIAAVPTVGEVFRKQMYDEYVHKVLEREERKQHKLIKISSHEDLPSKRKPHPRKHEDNLNKVEQEFLEKAKSRLSKYGIKLDESEAEGGASSGTELSGTDAKFLVDGREVKDARGLPKHLQEFLRLSATKEEDEENAGEWRCVGCSIISLYLCVMCVHARAKPIRSNDVGDARV